MKFNCPACCRPWFTLDEEPNPPEATPNRSCPKCMKAAGYKWVNVLSMDYTEIKEAA